MMRLAILVLAASLPGIAQAQSVSCAYGAARDCSDLRDRTERVNHDDRTNRTIVPAMAVLDITDRADRDDRVNRTRVPAMAVLDITDRANRDDPANRTRIIAVTALDITDRANRDDRRDRTPACP